MIVKFIVEIEVPDAKSVEACIKEARLFDRITEDLCYLVEEHNYEVTNSDWVSIAN